MSLDGHASDVSMNPTVIGWKRMGGLPTKSEAFVFKATPESSLRLCGW